MSQSSTSYNGAGPKPNRKIGIDWLVVTDKSFEMSHPLELCGQAMTCMAKSSPFLVFEPGLNDSSLNDANWHHFSEMIPVGIIYFSDLYLVFLTDFDIRIFWITARCSSYNIINVIICKLCNKCYVGRSTRPLKTRVGVHRRSFYKL